MNSTPYFVLTTDQISKAADGLAKVAGNLGSAEVDGPTSDPRRRRTFGGGAAPTAVGDLEAVRSTRRASIWPRM